LARVVVCDRSFEIRARQERSRARLPQRFCTCRRQLLEVIPRNRDFCERLFGDAHCYRQLCATLDRRTTRFLERRSRTCELDVCLKPIRPGTLAGLDARTRETCQIFALTYVRLEQRHTSLPDDYREQSGSHVAANRPHGVVEVRIGASHAGLREIHTNSSTRK